MFCVFENLGTISSIQNPFLQSFIVAHSTKPIHCTHHYRLISLLALLQLFQLQADGWERTKTISTPTGLMAGQISRCVFFLQDCSNNLLFLTLFRCFTDEVNKIMQNLDNGTLSVCFLFKFGKKSCAEQTEMGFS